MKNLTHNGKYGMNVEEILIAKSLLIMKEQYPVNLNLRFHY